MTKSDTTQINTCPFLGLSDDTTSHMAFTSPDNICHQCKPFVQIKLEHQNDYCLDVNFSNCPVYVNGAGKRMPVDLIYDGRADQQSAPMDRRILWAGVVLAIIFAMIVLFFFTQSKSRRENLPTNPLGINAAQSLTVIADSPSSSPTSSPLIPSSLISSPEISTTLPLQTASITPFPTLTSIPTATQAVSSTFTPTSTQIPPYSLELPIGNGQLYLIHKVVNGENLSTLTETYQTSLEAILAVNSTLAIPIRIDSLVIIPLKNKNPQGLPKLEPYQVTQNEITPETLAEQLKTDSALFKSLNNFEDGEKLNIGNWVLVPR